MGCDGTVFFVALLFVAATDTVEGLLAELSSALLTNVRKAAHFLELASSPVAYGLMVSL